MRLFLIALCMIFISASSYANEVYERVMDTQTIRCGYIIYPPLFDKDLNTGGFSGLNYDIMEAIGKELGISIEWLEEVGTDNAFTGLESGRYDSVCIGFWEIPTRAKAALFTTPLYFEGVYAYARQDDARFDKDPQMINTGNTKIVVLEGEMSQFIAQDNFPEAQVITQPGTTGAAVRFVDVANKKADVTFNEHTVYKDYNKNNPNKIKRLYPEPLIINHAAFSVARDEQKLVNMLNSTIRYLHNKGTIREVLKKYDPEGEIYLPATQPYEVKE